MLHHPINALSSCYKDIRIHRNVEGVLIIRPELVYGCNGIKFRPRPSGSQFVLKLRSSGKNHIAQRMTRGTADCSLLFDCDHARAAFGRQSSCGKATTARSHHNQIHFAIP